VMQIGGRNKSGGIRIRRILHEPADCAFSQKTNEIFVADARQPARSYSTPTPGRSGVCGARSADRR
jgi:hypothetical protein